MSDVGYLQSRNKEQCFGCEACVQICPRKAIALVEDEEGFRYPYVKEEYCIHCQRCHEVCPYENMPRKSNNEQFVFGGYSNDDTIRQRSTSGGAFSAIVNSWCEGDYVIFGAVADGLDVYHSYINDKNQIDIFRKSKYSQSKIGSSYQDVKRFLSEDKKVVFSGTPCHIAGLKSYLGSVNTENLLLIEVVCEGIPSPLYIRKYNEWCNEKYGGPIESLDYRYKDGNKWDFQVMLTKLREHEVKIDRWFNPFWSIWLNHLMSRPSCYKCPFTTKDRIADITLGDLWGVHIYCPELYGKNRGASLIVCNTEKGKKAFFGAEKSLYGHELDIETALKYQSPMRKTISNNPNRELFMKDLIGTMKFEEINRKWAKAPSIKLLWQKYVWGNRQKVALWNFRHRIALMKETMGIKKH